MIKTTISLSIDLLILRISFFALLMVKNGASFVPELASFPAEDT